MKIVVFSGGNGTRMWPVSRKNLPKQFQNLVGEKSMFQQMVDMLFTGFAAEDIFVVTGKDYVELVKTQEPKLPTENILGEPEMRDTLAAVGFASAYLSKKFPGETMAAIWGADHIVKEVDTFIRALKVAEELAVEKEVIAKVDVRPTFPSVHLGYIKIGDLVEQRSEFEIYEFEKHVEKPDFETALRFLETGKYLWNTGYFVWKLEKIMELFKKYTPEVSEVLVQIQKAVGTNNETETIANLYQNIDKISIDNALFEKLDSADQLEIIAQLGWTDIGAWNVLKDELASESMENVTKGEHINIDTTNCLVFGPEEGKKIIATIGLEGLIIVDTKDALLICPKDRSQDVKKVVEAIKERNKEEYL